MGLLDIFKPKLKHSDPDVRSEAVKKITDQAVLVDIAKNASDEDVRRAAIGQITDQDVLIDIAKNDLNPSVRCTAIMNITDEKVIANFAVPGSGGSFTEAELITILTRLTDAYAFGRRDTINDLEPTAHTIGVLLDRRGGIKEMRRIFYLLPDNGGKRTLEMHWGGIGDWRG